jgi:hypothetical protein
VLVLRRTEPVRRTLTDGDGASEENSIAMPGDLLTDLYQLNMAASYLYWA